MSAATDLTDLGAAPSSRRVIAAADHISGSAKGVPSSTVTDVAAARGAAVTTPLAGATESDVMEVPGPRRGVLDTTPTPGNGLLPRTPRDGSAGAEDVADDPAETDVESDPEQADPGDPDVSAKAIGSAARAEPTPKATASAPTRPTYRELLEIGSSPHFKH